MARPQHRQGQLLWLLAASVFFLLALLHSTHASTYSRNPLARAVHKIGKVLQRRVQAARRYKHQQYGNVKQGRHAGEDEDEDLETSVHVDVEEAGVGHRGGRRSRRRLVRQLQLDETPTPTDTGKEEEDDKDPSSSTPEPMKITLDLNFKDVGGGGNMAPAAFEGEAPTDVPSLQQHRTLIIGVALGGGILLLALAFTFIRQAYLRRQQQQQQQQPHHQLAGATLEASPKRKRPMEFNSVTGAGANPNGSPSAAAGAGERSLSGRLAGERAGGNNLGTTKNSKGSVMVREESRIDSVRSPTTARGDFFQLKEIDLGGGGVQSPGRGGPGAKLFSPRG